MDHRHLPPMISMDLNWDWSNPLVYWFIGLFGAVITAVILALAQ